MTDRAKELYAEYMKLYKVKQALACAENSDPSEILAADDAAYKAFEAYTKERQFYGETKC